MAASSQYYKWERVGIVGKIITEQSLCNEKEYAEQKQQGIMRFSSILSLFY